MDDFFNVILFRTCHLNWIQQKWLEWLGKGLFDKVMFNIFLDTLSTETAI